MRWQELYGLGRCSLDCAPHRCYTLRANSLTLPLILLSFFSDLPIPPLGTILPRSVLDTPRRAAACIAKWNHFAHISLPADLICLATPQP